MTWCTTYRVPSLLYVLIIVLCVRMVLVIWTRGRDIAMLIILSYHLSPAPFFLNWWLHMTLVTNGLNTCNAILRTFPAPCRSTRAQRLKLVFLAGTSTLTVHHAVRTLALVIWKEQEGLVGRRLRHCGHRQTCLAEVHRRWGLGPTMRHLMINGEDSNSIRSLAFVSFVKYWTTWEVGTSEYIGRRCRRSRVSGRDILWRNLKGLGFNLLYVAPHFNGLVVPDFGCRKQLSETELEMRLEKSSIQ